jgi:hypothetical protein
MQDLESESLLMGAEHSQTVKAAPIKSDYGSRDCVDLASSTAESRIIEAPLGRIRNKPKKPPNMGNHAFYFVIIHSVA